ncbi:hypothetical protein G7K_0311-t1 [Saitoella complicata NRRL Y-17804]|uniref:Uncharacterized protein n=1 Tax=Saitoella complicata (strain BCRC 22490 / CBS 7301 / JCM 7358 / NBRC 10748 / NRRL Y-17804) TaxID=698492 RepID=A0A0E9N8E3_SAICN|nr:hypothetical protein G7K_0311-t1 [Saitoella complicata NRRL Y-17804]
MLIDILADTLALIDGRRLREPGPKKATPGEAALTRVRIPGKCTCKRDPNGNINDEPIITSKVERNKTKIQSEP